MLWRKVEKLSSRSINICIAWQAEMEGENYFSLKLQITCREYKAGNALQEKRHTFNSIV